MPYKKRYHKKNLAVISALVMVALLWGGAFFVHRLAARSLFFANQHSLEERPSLGDNQPAPRNVKKDVLIKGIYLTGWTAGGRGKLDKLLDLIDATELNAVVIDIKDSTGKITFKTSSSLIEEAGAGQIKIADIKGLIGTLHEKEIYVIGRIAVFEDPELAFKKPHLALKNKYTGKPWKNLKGLVWVDPAAKDVWDYNIALAKEGISAGFDEINFDYIRFPSDGELSYIAYPFWDGKAAKHEIIRSFFEYAARELKPLGVMLSADLFGQTAWQNDGLNIGQRLSDAALYFDVISPMLYPSHFPAGFAGLKNPAEYPYEIIFQSLIKAQKNLNVPFANATQAGIVNAALAEDGVHPDRDPMPKASADVRQPAERLISNRVKIRPWLQDFDLGANYNERMIRLQKKAVEDAARQIGSDGAFGWIFWNAGNNYTEEAFDKITND